MNIKSDIPQMEALRQEVEKVTGKINSHSSFIKLQEIIEERVKEHISVSTLERMWGYSTRKGLNISVRILNIISRLVGEEDWDAFCKKLKEGERRESEILIYKSAINCYNLAIGTRIKIGWGPDRVCEIEHQGEGGFIVVEAKNASIKEGDSFICSIINKGEPMYIECLKRNGEPIHNEGTTRYVIGQTNGITMAEIIKE